jgi:hypothetical protein
MTNNLKEDLNEVLGQLISDAIEGSQESSPYTAWQEAIDQIKVETTQAIFALINQKEKESRAKEAEWSLSNLELIKGQSFNDGLVYKNQLDRIKQLKEELKEEVV